MSNVSLQERILGMSRFAHETLTCLFFHGPTRDGGLPSKSGRDELVRLGMAERLDGWQWLTREGMDFSIAVALLGGEKDKWQRRHKNFPR